MEANFKRVRERYLQVECVCRSSLSRIMINFQLAFTSYSFFFFSFFREAVQNVVNDLPEVDLYASGPSQNSVKSNKAVPLDLELVNASIEPVPQSIQKCTNFNDKLLYIYTSGTTGLPKAAVIKNSRCVSI